MRGPERLGVDSRRDAINYKAAYRLACQYVLDRAKRARGALITIKTGMLARHLADRMGVYPQRVVLVARTFLESLPYTAYSRPKRGTFVYARDQLISLFTQSNVYSVGAGGDGHPQ